jgi:cytochrome c-type biogenesis protein CcmH/NrfF
MEAIDLDKLDMKRENERTYIKKKLNVFMCSKCDMICAETRALPDGMFFKDDAERRRKTETKRIYCISCDEESIRRDKLMKHWLCCFLGC